MSRLTVEYEICKDCPLQGTPACITCYKPVGGIV